MTAVNGVTGGTDNVSFASGKTVRHHDDSVSGSIFNKKIERNRAHATGGIVAFHNIGNYLNGSTAIS